MISATIGRYNIIEEMGRGGLGIIYKGEDPVLDRMVAIKILPPHLVSDSDSKERFIREAQAAARLNHPNIQGIYDISEHEGIYFIVFQYVEGQTLEQLMEKSRAYELEEALKYFLPACNAIDYAHQHNVLHRNIKPANILLSNEGQIKVADFGLAWAESEQSLTETSSVLGTFSYFSPEQTRGERVDQRSDIYSLGVLLYQMLTRKLPFTADTPAALIEAHLSQEPAPPSKLNGAIPKEMDRCILRSLEKEPDKRYESVRAMIEDLTAIAFGKAQAPEISPSEAAAHNTLGNNYYKQGKLDLAILEWEKATVLDPYNALTHNNLGTAYDGLGKVDSAVKEYRRAVELNPNNFIAHYNFGSALYRSGDLDAGIGEYGKVIALNPKFAPAYYNLGNSYYKKGDLEKAVEQWQKALVNNPEHAEAIYNLGIVYWKKRKKEEALEQWKRAVELDPKFALALFNLGAAYYKEGKTELAKAEWIAALEINPEFAEANYNMGVMAYENGNLDEAIESWEKAIKMRPAYWQAFYNLANAHYQRENLALAEENWRKTLDLKENFWQAHWNLGNLYAFKLERTEEALQEWQAVTLIKADHWPAYFNIGEVYFNDGKVDLAKLEWEKVIAINPKYWPAYHNLGSIAYKLGDFPSAVSLWAKALATLIFGWS